MVTTNTKELNWARDEVFIIGVNESVKEIEKIETNIYSEPMMIYAFFATVSALYSKAHEYIQTKRDIGERLKKLRKGLYNKKFMDDLKRNKNYVNVQKHFEKLLDDLVKVYREMTTDFTNVGMFAKINIDDGTPGVVRNR